MTDQTTNRVNGNDANEIHHLTPHRKSRLNKAPDRGLDAVVIAHVREQNEKLVEQNKQLMES